MNWLNKHYDLIVVGVGDMGSATVYGLAKRGFKVLGLDRYSIPNKMGFSHGFTRIFPTEHRTYFAERFFSRRFWFDSITFNLYLYQHNRRRFYYRFLS
ncbi:MAG: hypothetical protein AAGF26_13080 [Cyanobacteria bacterium P01_G01_bin.49]